MGMAQEVLEDFRPEVVALVGIAGGLEGRDGVHLGDVVIPSYVHYVEFRKLTGAGDLRRYVAFDQPSKSILECFAHPACRDAWHTGVTVSRPDGSTGTSPQALYGGSLATGEKIYGDPSHEEQQLLLTSLPDAIAVDMESYGVARAVFESRNNVNYNPRLVVVRGISDLVHRDSVSGSSTEQPEPAVENSEERRQWRPYAAATAAAFTAALIARLERSSNPRAASTSTGGPQ